jgi:Flp pilus assembly protein TadG
MNSRREQSGVPHHPGLLKSGTVTLARVVAVRRDNKNVGSAMRTSEKKRSAMRTLHDRKLSGATWRIAGNRGSAAIPFLIALPIFLMIVGILVQYALIVNAKSMLDEATILAARSAATCLPDQESDRIAKAARMALVTISPQAKVAEDPEGSQIAGALGQMGATISDTYASRYTYAKEATTVTWNPSGVDFLKSPGQEVEVTVKYRYFLTVPGAMRFVSDSTDPVAGVPGRFVTLISRCKVQTAHGRQTMVNTSGWPN